MRFKHLDVLRRYAGERVNMHLVFYIDTHVCIILKFIGANKEKEMCLPYKEYISGQMKKV